MAELAPCLDETYQFTRWLAPDGEMTFQIIPEASSIPEDKQFLFRKVLHGPLEQHCNQLTAFNMLGGGVFLMVNRGDGIVREGAKTCRTIANVQSVRAVFVDLDGSPLEPVLAHSPPPHAVIESSPGKWHCYWKINDCHLDNFTRVQIALAKQFDGDPAVKDLPRVMRMPGFWHQKSTPFRSRIHYIQD